MYSYGSPHMATQKQDDQLERTFSSYVRIRDVVLKTYLGRWTIGRSGERESGISVLPARYDDDDNHNTNSIHRAWLNTNHNGHWIWQIKQIFKINDILLYTTPVFFPMIADIITAWLFFHHTSTVEKSRKIFPVVIN